MTKNVVTAYADSSVSKAIKLMVQNNIGSIIVKDNTGPIGIFTERDLISKVLAPGKEPESQILMEVTPRAFNAIGEDQTLGHAAKQMISKKGRLTVFEGDELVGIVTPTDIVRAVYENEMRFFVGDCVRKKVELVDSETPAISVIQTMDKKRIGSVLVNVDAQLGIFTERDVLKKLLARHTSLNLPVRSLVTKPLISGAVGMGGYEVAEMMVKNRIKRLPLRRAGKIAGILTARDVVKGCALRIK